MRQRSAYLRATDRYEVSCNHSDKGVNESHTVDCEAFRDELRSLLHRYLVALPPNQQEVIHLAFFEEKSQREISAFTQTPLRTVKTRNELGIEKLSHVARRFAGKRWYRLPLPWATLPARGPTHYFFNGSMTG